jgi:hypothetical protein
MSTPKYRPLTFGVTRVSVRDGASGVHYLSAEQTLQDISRCASPTACSIGRKPALIVALWRGAKSWPMAAAGDLETHQLCTGMGHKHATLRKVDQPPPERQNAGGDFV